MDEHIAKIWLEISVRDLEDARVLLEGERFIGAVYSSHQAVEKALKAYIFSVFDIDPDNFDDKTVKKYKIHNLSNLAEYTNLEYSEEQWEFFNFLYSFYTPVRYGRYKEKILSSLTPEIAARLFFKAEEFVLWMSSKLSPKPNDLPKE